VVDQANGRMAICFSRKLALSRQYASRARSCRICVTLPTPFIDALQRLQRKGASSLSNEGRTFTSLRSDTGEAKMAWKAPKIVEVPGWKSYACAARK
jgi:hypothetical protein